MKWISLITLSATACIGPGTLCTQGLTRTLIGPVIFRLFQQSANAAGRPKAFLPHVHRLFAFWTNIQVDHCFGAFGFVTGMRIPGNEFQGDFCGGNLCASSLQAKEAILTFAFSGDARPCMKLVKQVQAGCTRFVGSNLSFLLHNAG